MAERGSLYLIGDRVFAVAKRRDGEGLLTQVPPCLSAHVEELIAFVPTIRDVITRYEDTTRYTDAESYEPPILPATGISDWDELVAAARTCDLVKEGDILTIELQCAGRDGNILMRDESIRVDWESPDDLIASAIARALEGHTRE